MVVLRKRLRWALVAAAALALLLVVVQAGDASGRGAEASATRAVEIKNFAFRPATLKVPPGTQVRWTNASNVPHTATRTNGFDTRRIAPGSSASVRFKRKGTFSYHCKIHSFMKGKIVVE